MSTTRPLTAAVLAKLGLAPGTADQIAERIGLPPHRHLELTDELAALCAAGRATFDYPTIAARYYVRSRPPAPGT